MGSEHARTSTESRRRLPAWLLSAVLHTLLVLLVSFVFHSPDVTPVVERPVSIVLTSDWSRDVRSAHSPSGALTERGSDLSDSLPSTSAMSTKYSVNLPVPGHTSAPQIDSVFLEVPRRPLGKNPDLPSGIDPSKMLAEEAERRRREAARGKPTTVRLFGNAAQGRTFLFLIDRSKSMGKQGLRALAAAEAELLRSLSHLQPNHRFQVIAYHHRCVYLNEDRLLPATAKNLSALRGHLSNLAAFGATEHENAIRTALTWEPDALFVLTDGGDPQLSDAQLQAIKKRARGRTVIHCVEFGFGPRRVESNFLTRLANENGGSYGYVDMAQP